MKRSSGDDALIQELYAVYQDADVLFAGWSCPASTECCRFGLTGLEPYVTSIEYTAVIRAVKKAGGLPLAARKALPLLDRGPRDQGSCRLLDADGRCTIYEARPFGCRTFFCSKAFEGKKVPHKQVLALVRRIQLIAAKHTPGGDESHRFSKLLEKLGTRN